MVPLSRVAGLKAQLQEQRPLKGFIENGLLGVTRLRKKPRAPARGGMWLSSEALAKEEVASGVTPPWRCNGSCPWGSTARAPEASWIDLKQLFG